jgi:hypothetical protein
VINCRAFVMFIYGNVNNLKDEHDERSFSAAVELPALA